MREGAPEVPPRAVSAATRRALALGAAAALLWTAGCGPREARPSVEAPPLPDACRELPPPEDAAIKRWLDAGCYKHPALAWTADHAPERKAGPTRPTAPHGRVRVHYSPVVVAWLRAGRPERGLPDGAMMVKEMFDWETGRELVGRSVMLMERRASHTGWYWYPRNGWTGAGCIGCHASAERELTFADLHHITGEPRPLPRTRGAPGARVDADHPGIAEELLPEGDAWAAFGGPPGNPAFVAAFPWTGPVTDPAELGFPSWRLGYAWPPAAHGPDAFLPSTQCVGCHSAGGLAPGFHMTEPDPEDPARVLNLSPFAEWGASLMGLAGRDPVFHAQLESEKALRPAWAATLDDTCYGCHGVAGRRQVHLDRDAPFRHEMVFAGPGDPDAKYGALARDGITCLACHKMAPEGLGEPATWTGRFRLAAADVVLGPYDRDVKARPMENALGLTPRGGAHVRSSALCGSCHSVVLPQVPLDAPAPTGDPLAGDAYAMHHEQATYSEWQNSAYQDEREPVDAANARTCQGCHMPAARDDGRPLVDKVANIEEYMAHVPGSLGPEDITLPRRAYARHTLVGLNAFVLAMFERFGGLLGVPDAPPWAEGDGPGGRPLVGAFELARREMARLGRTATAEVQVVDGPRWRGGRLEATVRVTNLAGHKVPTGVGFRRAFLAFEVLDAAGAVIWASGATDGAGRIVGSDGRPLVSELTPDWRHLQPHHARIERPEQVQVYEERHLDERGALTTSFLGLWRRVKDTRLLPRGWSRRTEAFDHLQPQGLHGEPVYPRGEPFDEVTYAVRLPDGAPPPAAVRATLCYQAIPPYWLAERLRTARGPATQRLYWLASRLPTDEPGSLVGDWTFRLVDTGPVAVPPGR